MGDEFQVNYTEDGAQTGAQITELAGGGFVIVWNSSGQDGDGFGVYAQVYGADGQPDGAEFRISDETIGNQVVGSIEATEDGGFKVAYYSDTQDAYYLKSYNIDATGATQVPGKVTLPFNNFYTYNVEVAADGVDITALSDGTGRYMVTWTENNEIKTQLYNSDNSAATSILTINDITANGNRTATATELSDGTIVFTWQAWGTDGHASWGIHARHYDPNTGIWGPQLNVDTAMVGEDYIPHISALSDGGYVIIWEDDSSDGSGFGIFGQRFDESGNKVGVQFQVNVETVGKQINPDVTALDDGGFLVVWDSRDGQDGSFSGQYGQRYDVTGVEVGSEFLINDTTTSYQYNHNGDHLVALSDGRVVAIWQSPDSDSYGITAKILETQVTGAVSGAVTEDIDPDLDGWLEVVGAVSSANILGVSGTFAAETIVGAYGSLIIDAVGNWSYAADNTQTAIQALGVGGTMTDVITVRTIEGITQTVTITFVGANDAPTDIQLSYMNVVEGATGVVIGTLSTIDDIPDSHTYTVDDVRFEVVNGELKLKDATSLDMATEPTVNVTITATDSLGLSYSEVFALTVTDPNNEFQVNTYEPGAQTGAQITELAGGGFVVVWNSSGQDGDGFGVYAQVYGADGQRDGGEFRISDETTGNQVVGSVEATENGGFLIAYYSEPQDEYYLKSYDVDATGATQVPGKVTLPFNNFYTYNVEVAADGVEITALSDGTGRYIVVWTTADDGSYSGIKAQLYDVNGNPINGSFTVNATTFGDQRTATATVLADGTMVFTWQSYNTDGNLSWGTYARHYDPATGYFLETEIKVNTQKAGEDYVPHIAALSDGGYVIIWENDSRDLSGFGIYGQRFEANGTPVGSEFRVNTETADNQMNPDVTALDDGGFLVTWESFGQDGDSWGQYGQRYDVNGAIVGDEFLINDTTAGYQYNLNGDHLVTLSDGSVVATWYSSTGDSDVTGIMAKILETQVTGAVSGAVTEDIDPDLDGLLEEAGVLLATEIGGVSGTFIAQTNSAGTYGTFSITTGGVWSYAADNTQAVIQALGVGETLSDVITVNTADGFTGAVTITITGTNDAPTANADTNVATEDTATVDTSDPLDTIPDLAGAVGNVLDNDTDPDANDVLGVTQIRKSGEPTDIAVPTGTIGVSAAGTYGSLFIEENGSYTYTLDDGASNATLQALGAGETADETFTYTMSDGTETVTATLTITITGTNDAPVLTVDGAGGVTEDATTPTLTDSGLLSFTDVDTTDTHTVTESYNGDAAWSSGTLSVAQETALTAGFSVTGTNWDYTALNADTQFLAAGETVIFTYNVTVTDSANATDTKAVTITITGTNDAAVIAGTDTGAVTEDLDPDLDGLLETSGVLTITDVDTGEASFTAGIIAGSYGNLTIDAVGNWSYAADNTQAAVQSLGAGIGITDTIAVTAADGTTHNVVITITGTNDAPEANADTNVATEDTATVDTSDPLDTIPDLAGAVGNVLDNDTDPDANDVLGVTQIRKSGEPTDIAVPTGTIGVSAAGTYGSLFIEENGSYTYTLDDGASNATLQALGAGETADETFTYTMSDGTETVTATLTITITGTNDAPIAAADTNTIAEDAVVAVTGNVLANDGDTDTSDILMVSAINGVIDPLLNVTGTYGTLDWAADGSYSYAVNNANTVVQALAVGESITDVFTYTVSDGNGGTDITTLTLTITGTNDAPTAADNTLIINEDTSTALTALDFGFSDVDVSDALSSVTITTLETVGSLEWYNSVSQAWEAVILNQTITRADIDLGYLMFKPALNDNGTGYSTFGFTVSDDSSAANDTSGAHTITYDVTPVNDAPTASNQEMHIGEGATAGLVGGVVASDIEGDSLTYSITNVVDSEGTYTDTNLADQTGWYMVDNVIYNTYDNQQPVGLGEPATTWLSVRVWDGASSTNITVTVVWDSFWPCNDPLVFDLDGDGIELISAIGSTVQFDMDGDGKKEFTGWVGADDGMLVLDRNGNGVVDDINEISFIGDFAGATSDLEGLRAYDSNGDGVLDINDERFGEFQIWQDKNSDGKTDKGELLSLTEMGITSIDLNYVDAPGDWRDAADNYIMNTTSYTMSDGSTGEAGDVILFYTENDGTQKNTKEKDQATIDAQLYSHYMTKADEDVNATTHDDMFIFVKNWANDTITGFEDGSDMIDLTDTNLTYSDLTISVVGGDTIIDDGLGNTITLYDITSGIDQNDFVF